MTYSEPAGFRLPSSVRLPSVSRALERFGWPVWRTEVVRAVTSVAVDLLADPDHALQRLSHDQVGPKDLPISATLKGGVLLQAAEFLDVMHGRMHLPSAVPLARTLDLRCRAEFMDDRTDPERTWTYVLFGTGHASIEAAFRQLKGIEPYPVARSDMPHPGLDGDPEWEERQLVWDRVLAPYARFTPLSISAPEPQVMFDITQSLRPGSDDEQLASEGLVTVSAVLAELSQRMDDVDMEELRQLLIAPRGA